MSGWQPVAPDTLAASVAARASLDPGLVRVAVDGPPCARPLEFATALLEHLRTAGRPADVIDARTFWRDASLRLEYGREDTQSYPDWLDTDALRREALDPVVERGGYLPSLRDPVTNRSTRAPVRSAPPGTVLIVAGTFLIGAGLPFDVVIVLSMSAAARARHTAADDAWTLPALAGYDADAVLSEGADIVIRMDDARHPAARGLR